MNREASPSADAGTHCLPASEANQVAPLPHAGPTFSTSASPAHTPPRLLSLDVYRGAVMLLLALNGFGVVQVAKDTDIGWIDWLGFHVSHPVWISQFHVIGFSAWDMIQPAFMFIVGVAVPYSFAKRMAQGESRAKFLRHAFGRALLLILLGVFLQSMRVSETRWIFINVLSQIGLGYGFLTLLVGRTYRTQMVVAGLVLVFSWLIYAIYPIAQPIAATAVAVPGQLPGFFGHWSIHANAGWAFDRWFLNLFPRSEPFETHSGGYHTLNFISAFVTMLMGLICGQVLRDSRFTASDKLRRFVAGGAFCLVLAVLLGWTVCPIVKRAWTPSWTLFSGAYVVWMLALFYWVIDVRGWKGWTFPVVVVGMNPLAMFFMGSTLRGWTVGQFHIHLPGFLFTKPWGHVMEASLAAFVFWLICLWMYRRKIFLRI